MIGAIVWGRKTVRRLLGYAADFCPICACARPFAVTRVGSAGHVYFITVGDGELVCHDRACTVCGVDLNAEPERYTSLAKATMPMDALLASTNPHFDDANRDRLALEDTIRANPMALSPQDRLTLIMTPFVLLAPRVSARDQKGGLNRGFMHREVMPVLVRALRRLQPSAKELQTTLLRLVQLKELIGSKIRLDELAAALANAGPAANPTQVVWTAVKPRAQLNAARLSRITSYLLGGAAVLMALATLLPSQTRQSVAPMLGLVWLAAGLAYGLHRTGRAIEQGKPWGRTCGLVVGGLMLLSFPVGTLAGAYMLWSLALRWEET